MVDDATKSTWTGRSDAGKSEEEKEPTHQSGSNNVDRKEIHVSVSVSEGGSSGEASEDRKGEPE